jgi:hypothetical protein
MWKLERSGLDLLKLRVAESQHAGCSPWPNATIPLPRMTSRMTAKVSCPTGVGIALIDLGARHKTVDLDGMVDVVLHSAGTAYSCGPPTAPDT